MADAVMPSRYRLIPVSVEAIQLTPETVERAATWTGGRVVEEIDPVNSLRRFVALNIPTLDGVKRASEGDFVVKSMGGEFDVMREREFRRRYEGI
jgi:hypothetical protein